MSETHASTENHCGPEFYKIRLKGHLDGRWADWFGGLTITLEEDGNTLLTGPVIDQAALHGLLKKVRDLGLPLVSVCPVEPSPSTTLPLRRLDRSGEADASELDQPMKTSCPERNAKMASDALQRIDENNCNPAVATLISAFSDDHIVKRLGLSQEMIKRMYEAPLNIGLRFGEVYATSDSCEGVMVFCPGERANLNLWEMIKNGMLFTSISLIRLLANKDIRRLSMILERDKKNLKIGPFFYLMAIGVLPESQGKGYGGQLLKYLCERADRETKAIYLETQTEMNVHWYEKFGFKVVKQVAISDWLTLWEMVREAN